MDFSRFFLHRELFVTTYEFLLSGRISAKDILGYVLKHICNFQEALQRDANNAEAVINLVVVSQYLGKPPEVSSPVEVLAMVDNFRNRKTYKLHFR